jgi:hypothetical protein
VCLLAFGITAAAVGAQAQDPLLTLPHAYKLVLENEWVKVVRVRYAPREKLPLHDHTQMAAAYVYLNDGGPVVFKHDYGAVVRPETKAGSFRLYRAIREVHAVDNANDVPSEFLRVELKTEPGKDERTLRGKFHREEVPAGQGLERVQFENEQLRVTRLLIAAGRRLELALEPEQPALLVELTGGAESQPGRTRWLPAASRLAIDNPGAAPLELLRFDLKTKPLPAPEAAQPGAASR